MMHHRGVALTREHLLEFLSSKTRADLSRVEDDTPLFSTGTVDSFAMVDLMFWLEKQTKARIGPDDVSIDNFDTVSRILAFVESRKR